MNQPTLFRTEPDPPAADSWPEEQRVALAAFVDIYGEPIEVYMACLPSLLVNAFIHAGVKSIYSLTELAKLIDDGFIAKDGDYLSITDKGIVALGGTA